MCLMEYLGKAIIQMLKFTFMVFITTIAVCFVFVKLGLMR